MMENFLDTKPVDTSVHIWFVIRLRVCVDKSMVQYKTYRGELGPFDRVTKHGKDTR